MAAGAPTNDVVRPVLPFAAFVDARCLQDDPSGRERAVFHYASLLRAARDMSGGRLQVTAMIDADSPRLPDSIAPFFDAVVEHANPVIPRHGAIFIAQVPMRSEPSRFMRLIGHERVLSAAVVHDFHPFDLAGTASLEWLKHYSVLFPTSPLSADRLRRQTGTEAEHIHVTGCVLRESLRAAPPPATLDHFILALEGDRPAGLRAVGVALDVLRRKGRTELRVKVLGFDSEADAEISRAGVPARLCGCVSLVHPRSDEELVSLYGRAIATIIAPPRLGLSVYAAESVASGAPVIGWDGSILSPSTSPTPGPATPRPFASLAGSMEAALEGEGWRKRVLESQLPVLTENSPERVTAAFWNRLLEEYERHLSPPHPIGTGSSRARIAIVTPFPPDRSGVAAYSLNTAIALKRYCDVSVFTDAPRPPEAADLGVPIEGSIDAIPLLHPSFDAVIFVTGNSHFHYSILELCERYGGPVIQHDSRLTHVYLHRWGKTEFRRRAALMLGRAASDEEFSRWERDEDFPSLLLEPIIGKAEPLIVHSAPFQALIKTMYGKNAELVPFAIPIAIAGSDLSPDRRNAARARLGVPSERLLISSFGYVHTSKASLESVAALALLRARHVPAELHFVGSNELIERSLADTVKSFGLADAVRTHRGFVTDDVYMDYILATDIAFQFRTYGLGQPSAGLSDCIAAGMACVANVDLAEACDAPGFVTRIPNTPDPVLIADAIMARHRSGDARVRERPERDEYVERHSFDHYARRLLEVLDR